MGKKFTNHSARKTTVSKLKKAEIVSSELIAKVSGHRGINFLNDYDEVDESRKSKPQKYKIPKIRPPTEKVKVMFKVEVIQAKSNTKQQSRQGQASKK